MLAGTGIRAAVCGLGGPGRCDAVCWLLESSSRLGGQPVGVLLYQLLCNGHHPFPNAMPTVGKPVTDPTAIRRDLNPDLATFLIQACAPASADRFATAADMRLALRNIRAGL